MRKNTLRLLLLFCIVTSAAAHAQVQQSGWLASFNTLKMHPKWSVHFDAQVRSTDNLETVQSVLLRPGLNYHLTKKLTFTAGYGYISNRRALQGITGYLSEHRLWQQALYNHNWSNMTTSHRLRLEQRFLPIGVLKENNLEKDGHLQAMRLRYFVRNLVPLQNGPLKEGWFAALQNEVFVNMANQDAVNGRFFDQNRLYTAVGYRFPAKIDVEAGYMNQYTKTRTAFTNNHVAQLAIYKRL